MAEQYYCHPGAPSSSFQSDPRQTPSGQLLPSPDGSKYEGTPPPLPQHPAFYAPFADDGGTVSSYHHQHQGIVHQQPSHEASDPTSPDPVACPEPSSPSQKKPRPVTVTPDADSLGGLHSPTFPRTAMINPAARDADDNDITNAMTHRPGQIAHPKQLVRGGTWSYSLCDCSRISTCCLGILCPCVLYGKINYRLSMKRTSQEPADLLGYRFYNGSCTAMAVLCGCQWLLVSIQRARTRSAYGIKGDVTSDCAQATCCTCCVLIQEENEIVKREEERRTLAVSAARSILVSPYTVPERMVYAQPLTG